MKKEIIDYRISAIKAALGDPGSSKFVNSERLKKAALFVAMDDGLRPGQVYETESTKFRGYTLWLLNDFQISWNSSGITLLEVIGKSIEYLDLGQNIADFRIDLESWKGLNPEKVDRETWKRIISEISTKEKVETETVEE